MKKLLILFSFVFLFSIVYASAEISYPIPELGNCANQQACEVYCDDVANMDACLNFAEKNNMMTPAEIAEARKFAPLLRSGDGPGNCRGKECKTYCDEEAHIIECVDFAVRAGVMDAKEAEMVKKTGGKGPGNCKGKEECDQYCQSGEHFSECVDFAVANGLMDPSEAEMAKKTGGKGPGNCKSKEECDNYCKTEAHIEECIQFSITNGMMKEQDAERMRKTGGKSPGNCKGEEECTKFCNSEEGKLICLEFEHQYGLISEEQYQEYKKGPNQENDTNYGNCLSQERWHQLDDECKAKGEGYHLQEVKGDDGHGKECVTDETCVQGSGKEWESQAEKDRQLAEMQKQWDEENAQHEAQYGPGTPGTDSSGGGGSEGGCTQPGPEGQCNPGPGAGPGPGSESSGLGGTTTGESNGGVSEGSGDSGSSSESSGGGGEQAAGTGAVITKTNSNGIITRLVEYIRNSF